MLILWQMDYIRATTPMRTVFVISRKDVLRVITPASIAFRFLMVRLRRRLQSRLTMPNSPELLSQLFATLQIRKILSLIWCRGELRR